jgi:hypothetical protein
MPHLCYFMFEKVIQFNERFLFVSRCLWRVIGFFFRRSFHVLHLCPIFTTHHKIFQSFIFIDVEFLEKLVNIVMLLELSNPLC